jgi:hypothetical protein
MRMPSAMFRVICSSVVVGVPTPMVGFRHSTKLTCLQNLDIHHASHLV